jgi:hypothetical protein
MVVTMYVTVATSKVEDRVISRAIARAGSQDLVVQVEFVRKQTGLVCGPGKEVTSREWVDGRLRHHETTLCIHQVNEP